MKAKDITNQRFGKLTAIKTSGKNKWGQTLWVCVCDCGNTKIIGYTSLIGYKTKSCAKCITFSSYKNNEKTCTKCRTIKPLSSFSKRLDRHQSLCKDCNKIVKNNYRKNQGPNGRKSELLRLRYKLTLEEYKEKLKAQDYSCLICKKHESLCGKNPGFNLAVDHCHKTLKNRGLLCRPCNSAIGLLKEDLVILSSAINYLKNHELK